MALRKSNKLDNMTADELVEKIGSWESDAGESFKDYFMHDNVKALSWAFYLLGRGFTEHALIIIGGLEKGETYFDQEELFDIYPEYIYDEVGIETWNSESYDKNLIIWAEFLVATASYRERVNKFFESN